MADIQFTPDAAQPPPINFTPDAAPDTGDPQADEANALAGGTQALAHQVVGGTLGAAGRLAGRVVDVLPPSTTLGTGADWNPAIPRKADVFGNAGASVMAPTTPEGQGVEQALGEAGAAVGRGVASIPGVNTPAGQTLLSTGGEALQDVGLVAGAAGVPRFINDLSTETSTIGRFGQPEAPPKITPGPITAEQLRSGPDRLPAPPTKAPAPSTAAPAPEVAPPVPVPGKPHIRPKIQAPPTEGEPPAAAAAAETTSTPAPLSETEAPAPATAVATPEAPAALAPPVKDEAEIAAGQPPSTSDQQARLAAVQQLQQDTGATMPNIRKSAVSGDYRETGTDYQLADKLGEPTMKAQLDQETHALQTASQNQIDSTGGVARGTGQGALEQRGGVFDSALQGIGNWFDKNIRQLYQTADQSAQQRPISNFGNLGAILGDHSQFTGVEGRQLHADISQVAQQFGMMGQGGFWKPTTVATAERFRQWLGEQYTPRTGRTIGRVKDALDADVASHGGQGLYDAGRALRYKRDQMLEGPRGIARLMPDKLPDGRLINRPVPLDRIMDHVSNLPREQFDHIVNVLHDSSKLGSGELAEGNARALNELRRHMAERLNEAGTSSRDGRWNPYAYHDQLDEYSTKLPAIFSPEGMRRFQTIHDAGNALRLNKNYPGAAKSIMDAGGLRALAASRIASGIEGSLVGWAGPLKGALWDTTVGPSVRKGLERAVGGSPEKRQAARAAARLEPLGAQFPGQRGAVGILNATRPPNDIQRTYEPATGEHIVTSTSGASRGQDWGATGKDIRETRSDTWGPWGKGEGTRRAAALADVAHARGGRLVSDTSVSPGLTKVYASLKHMGYDVKKNPAAELNPNTGNWTLPIGADPRDSVFTVGPKPGSKPVPSLAARFPGQRGGPKFTPKVEAPQTELPLEGAEKPMINIGLHQGDPSAGGRVIPQEEAQAALKSAGVNIHRANVVNPPGGEPTLVASLDRKLTDPEANAVANKLGQLAIPQRGPMGEGSMHGPGVNSKEAIEQGWNKYNPDYFRMHNGETATEHAAKAGEFNPEQLESKQTVNNPIRNAYPGIYDDPHEILGRLNISHEDPALGEVFPGWSRERLFNEFGNREGDLPGKLPGEAANPRGSKAASSVMTPENATRIENILKAAKEYPNLYHGMVPWYAMDPLYDAVKSEIGPKGAPAAYSRLNTLMGMASPGSDVVTEIRRGTAAHMMAAKEKFGKFMKYGGQSSTERGPGYPPELAGVPGHPYHRTAQGMPMQQYLKTGSVQMRSPKVPMYIQASGVPETGFQTNTPIGDAHWSRGVGLSDVRTSASPASSVRTSEISALAPWYREIAKRVGLTPVAAQALQWGALGGETGVETAVGAPKLELFAKEVKAAAKREGVEPKEMLKRIIRGMGRAG